MLDAFTEEQLRNLPEDTVIDESVLNFVLGSQEEDRAEEDNGHPRLSREKRSEDTLSWKLESYLDYWLRKLKGSSKG
jgi:hypothetical protein